jgi:hypothetical protein
VSIVPDWRHIGTGMSNFDHSIDDGFEDDLRGGQVVGEYAGWEFNAQVWFDQDSEEFVCEVWRYGAAVEVVRASSLQEIMSQVSDRWGWE